MGEIVVSVSEVMVGGVALIMSVLCVSDTDPSPSCTKKYTDCMSTDNKYSKANSNGWGDTLCAPDFVNVSPKNHLQIMGRYVDVVS